jgi:hypothetical protein
MKRLAPVVFTFVLLLSTQVFADCTAPSSPGVRICTPTANSTVVYTPGISFNSTPASGATITQFILYDNGHKEVVGQPYQTGETVIDFNIRNGYHNIVVNAWDNAGHLYQASRQFTIVGQGFPLFCSLPSTPGINFCVPPAGAVLGVSYPASAAATGYSKIVAMKLYADGVKESENTGSNRLSTGATVSKQGNHTIAFVAWDSTGHVFRNSRTIYSAYTYSWVDCPPSRTGTEPCTPGFSTTITPAPESYVGNSFTIKANILNNPRPITTMKAYVSGTLVATAYGPTMYQTVSGQPNGTHILTLQAWDTSGVLYRIQYNININVPH